MRSVQSNYIKRVFLLFSSLYLVSILTGCQSEEQQVVEAEVIAKPVKLFEVEPLDHAETLFFPAKVEAVRQVDLTFEVDGKIAHLNLPEGQKFKRGDLLASLKIESFERRLRESQLSLKDAKVELDRIKKVDSKGYISKQNVTKAETAYELAKIRVENARADMADSKLYAPFDGTVSKRLVEENTYVPRGSRIAELQDLTQVYFSIDVSERQISEIKGQKLIQAMAKLNNLQRTEYAVRYAEHEAKTNPVTQTYKVYFGMPYPDDNNINLGSHASLFITIEKSALKNFYKIPLSAVRSGADKQPYVWVYSEASQKASRVAVLLGDIHGDHVAVESGLKQGDRIVISGASKITENLKLTPFMGEM